MTDRPVPLPLPFPFPFPAPTLPDRTSAAGPEPAPPASGALRVGADLSVHLAGHPLASARHLALLAAIDRLGSLTHAARATGFSYKGAWNAIEHIHQLTGTTLLERAAGGKGGGFSRLTGQGRALVQQFEQMAQEHARFLERLNAPASPLPPVPALRTSARNQFSGAVRAIVTGPVNDLVTLALPSSRCLHASITHGSAVDLGLAPGVRAFALIKASDVVLAAADADAATGTDNHLTGQVTGLAAGQATSEVSLLLPGGAALVAVVPSHTCAALAVHIGQPLQARIRARHVLLGVPD